MLQLEAELVDQSGSGGSPISILQGARDLLVTEVPDERPTFLAHLNLGRKYFESGQLDRALDSYGAGLRLLRKQNGYLHFNQVRPFFDLILAVVDQNPDQRQELFELAFDAAQFIKTKRTVADIARVSARLSVGDSKVAEAIRALQDAEDRRNLLFQEYEAELGRVFDDRDKGRLAELRERIEATEQQVVELGEAAQAANPRYRLLVGTPAKANDVVATLRPREALIQVLLGEPSSYLLMVRNGEISLRLLDSSSSQVRRDVATLRDSLAPKLSATGGLYVSDFDMGTAHGLYQSLFGGIESELSGVEHLIVVPNESLLSMPFGLLVTDQLLEKRNYAKAAWLINKFAISVVPSARSLVDLRATARASTASKDFIGFADFMPVDHQSASQIRPPLSAECRAVPRHVDDFRRQLSEFPALSGTRKQVESIAENYPQDSVKLVLGQQFTDVSLQSAPLSDQLADYRIVHFATHGLLPSEINCKSEPALATSYAVSAGEDSDGLLDVTEIDRLKLDAELVVLSACNTAGEGGMEGGQALSGLARAFFYAGARSIIASHWSVLEDPTTDLMVSIFNRRRQRDGTIGWSEALRRGQMEAIESAKRTGRAHLAHPYFWGAFVVVGDGAQSEIPNLLAQGYF